MFRQMGVLASGVFFSLAANTASLFDPLDGQLDMSAYLSENAYGFLPVPVIITDPAVDGGLGLVGVFFHEDEDAKKTRMEAMRNAESDAARYLLPPSASALVGVATGNGSWFAGGGHMGFFRNGTIRYTGGGGYGDINLDFYGVGNIELSRPVSIKTKAAGVIQNLKFKIPSSRIFLGASQRYIAAEVSPNSLGILDEVLPPEWNQELRRVLSQQITTSGFGLVAEWDSRDNIFTPRSGYQYQLESIWFNESFGSDIDYQLKRLNGVNFWRLAKNFRLGLMLSAEYADSDELLPPYATPFIGLRGIPAMRYQGKLVGASEIEAVWEMNNRWRALAFAGAGKATNDTGDFSGAETHSAYGAGFRYQIARRYGFDMGVDIARGPEETVFYITAGSAWTRF